MTQFSWFPPKAPTTSRWFSPWTQGNITGTDQNVVTVTKAYFPFFTGKQSINVDAMGFWADGAASPTAGVWRAAIYQTTTWPTSLVPGNLVVDAGNISISAAGLNTATFTAVTLSAYTLYWMASKQETAPSSTTALLATTRRIHPWVPYQTINSGSGFEDTRFNPVTDTNATGSWPNPAGGSPAPSTTNVDVPIPYFRISGAT